MKKLLFLISLFALPAGAMAQHVEQADSVAARVELDEVVIKAMLVKHDSRSDEYRMVPELTQGTASAYDVLSRLPGVSYDNLRNALSVRMDPNVLVEVDGKRVSPEYVQALSPGRISRVQVVYAPPARYTSEGIRYVINIKLKSDYEGHDLYAGNYAMISAGGNNGPDAVANEQPKAQYIYSGEKVDVTAGYGFGTIHWNYPVGYSREYEGTASVKTGEASAKDPNDSNPATSHSANIGVDWQAAPHQTLSFRGTFQSDDTRHRSAYEVTQNEAGRDDAGKYLEQSDESSKARDAAGALYYQGMFQNGWTVYSALGYDRMRDKLDYGYSGGGLEEDGKYRNAKDYFRGELDLNRSFNDALTLNFGYRGVWNRYTTRDREDGATLLKNQEGRHNGYVFLNWSPGENLFLHVGSGVEAIRKEGLGQKRDWLEFLPRLTATWLPSGNVQLMAEYASKMEYPSLYQVSAAPAAIDRWLVQSGNPQLSPARIQTVSLQGTFFESLIIGAEYTHTHNSLTDWYGKSEGGSFLKTFTNARGREFKAVAAYDWTLAEGLTWSNILQWQWEQAEGRGLSNHASNFSWHSDAEYWIGPAALAVKAGYRREMQKIPLLQGWQQYGQDFWQVLLRKNFFNESLSVSLDYLPPLRTGVRENQRSSIDAPFLKQVQSQNLKTYDNLLMIRIEWRFNKGRGKQRRVLPYEFDTERKRDKGLF